MPLLFDNDWLRNRIEADPYDSEPSAGPTTSPDPTPSDDLVARLYEAIRDYNDAVSRPPAKDLSNDWAMADVAMGHGHLFAEAVARIVALQKRCAELEPLWANRSRLLGEQQQRALRAEAEVAKLRRVVEAAKEMRSCYMNVATVDTPQSVQDFNAALAELDKP